MSSLPPAQCDYAEARDLVEAMREAQGRDPSTVIAELSAGSVITPDVAAQLRERYGGHEGRAEVAHAAARAP